MGKAGAAKNGLAVSPVRAFRWNLVRQTSKPLNLVVGHAHGDHFAQTQNFLSANVPVYANRRSRSALAGVQAPKDNIKQVNNVEEGDQFDTGSAAVPLKLEVYSPAGHENSLVMLHQKGSGYLFVTDFYGCTRMGAADNESALPGDHIAPFL